MSADITLKTEKINVKRKTLADKMALLFGPYTLEADTYVFAPTFAEMANTLFLDGSLISRLLAPPNLEKPSKNTVSEKSYNTILKIVNALIQQKKAMEEKHQAEIITLRDRLEKQTLTSAQPADSKRTAIWKIFAATLLPLLVIAIYFINRDNKDLVKNTTPTISDEQPFKNRSPYSSKVVNIPPETILNPGFEEDETNRVWTHWNHSKLGGPLQPSYTQVFQGKTSAKLPETGDRIGYQLIRVAKNTDYVLDFNYLMRGSGTPSGSLTMSILSGGVNRTIDINPAIIASTTIQFEQKHKNIYRKESLRFNSGNQTNVAIYFSNKGIQCKLDNLELKRQ